MCVHVYGCKVCMHTHNQQIAHARILTKSVYMEQSLISHTNLQSTEIHVDMCTGVCEH